MARLAAHLPRLVVLTVVWLLAAATWTLAAENQNRAKPTANAPAEQGQEVLDVPDVRTQPFVFAKGILEDAGFAWRVEGRVDGYAANVVVAQRPAPRTHVVDTGAPTIVLRLARSPQYAERGLPENSSPYEATPLVRPEAKAKAKAKAKAPLDAPDPANASKERKSTAEEQTSATRRDARAKAAERRASRGKAGRRERKPAFVVPGAPREPRDELRLPDRARMLEHRLAGREPTKKLVRYWLYQHAWIVTGARYGWSGGAEALRILITIDKRLQERWGVGARSEAVARAALKEVERRARK